MSTYKSKYKNEIIPSLIKSGKYKTNSDIGLPSQRYFANEIDKYSVLWREGGQFSTKKYKSKKDLV